MRDIGSDFALVPDNGPPRLIRYDLPWSDYDLVAVLEIDQNLLRINREIYDKLSAFQQHMVLLCRKEFLYIGDLPS